ncbi:MAG: FG-GAP repeat domain-containing protein [Chitinophagales bacterium]
MRKFLLFWSVLLLGSIGVKGQELFAPEQIISSSFINESARYIHATDINGDNHLDILATFKGEVVWYENNGNTQFGNPVQVTNSIVETNSEIAYGSDIDGDGDMDVLTASLGGVQWYKNDNGLGDFGIQNSIIGVKNISDVACVDLDSDGDFDVIVKGEEVIVWCKNDGKGNFEEFLEIENASTSESFRKGLYVSDLDKDGDVDFIASLDESIGWYENDGQGNFTKKVISTNDGNIRAIYGSDVDNDGDIDIFCGFSHPTLFVWYENDGVANFNEEHFISSSSTNSNYSNSLYSTDLDNDNDMDVVSALGFSNKLVWYENGGYGNFSGENIISIDTEKIVFVCGYDIDKDGDMDVFSVSYKDSKIAWYENILDETEIRMLAFQDLNENGIYEDSEPLIRYLLIN